jgi:hypothetical protein
MTQSIIFFNHFSIIFKQRVPMLLPAEMMSAHKATFSAFIEHYNFPLRNEDALKISELAILALFVLF